MLAGGEGQRMRPFIRTWLGEERPKQYCTFVGSRSMLRHTWDRARALAPEEQVVTIVARDHRAYLAQAHHRAPGPLLVQPADCGTAPGVFLPASLVAARDPEAVVLLMPADHFIHPERRFLSLAESACRLAGDMPGRLVLLGAAARGAERDYGWIVPGPARPGLPLQEVTRFEEKPDAVRAAELFEQGGLWSTMVIAARVDTLWRLGERLLPAMMRPFRDLRRALAHPPAELPELRLAEAIAAAYRRMPRADFSRDLVQRCPEAALVLPMTGVDWCDWGRPERVAETLLRLGKRPAFPLRAGEALQPDAGELSLPA